MHHIFCTIERRNKSIMSEEASAVFPLLEVPESVRDLILSFVSSGDGGLRWILNLRLVCKATKLWIDSIPKRQADVIFSRAHVAMNCEIESIRRFLTCPPPFGVTTLSLQNETLHGPGVLSSEEEETWNKFSKIWNSKLESIKLKSSRYCEDLIPLVLTNLMELPNLRRLELCQNFTLCRESMSCFEKVREVYVKAVQDKDSAASNTSEFFMRLQNNSNLTILVVSLADIKDYIGFTNLINHKREDKGLQVTLRIVTSSLTHMALQNSHCRTAFQNFATSIVTSKSTIRLKIDNLRNFERLMNTELCPHAVYLDLLTKIESVQSWEPKEDSLSLLEYLPRLKRLESIVTLDSSVEINRLTFPPSLQKVGFIQGFNAFGNLPPNLTYLSLGHWQCDVGNLVNSINLLRDTCPSLQTLRFSWQLIEDQGTSATVNFKTSPEFKKLETLSFTGSLRKANVRDCRDAISNAFNWQLLKLHSLELSFYVTGDVPMIQPEIITKVLEGQSVRTLVSVDIARKSVAHEDFPLLDKLESLASINFSERKVWKSSRQ